MRQSSQDQTLFVPKHRSTSIVDRATTGLPADLLNRAAARLQALAWLYAFTFFMAAFFPMFLFPDGLSMLFERALNWAPELFRSRWRSQWRWPSATQSCGQQP